MSAPLLWLYRGATGLVGAPLGRALVARRRARGKEHPERWPERLGAPSASRPAGPLVWLHAASVGETVSLLPLAAALGAARPDLAQLVTTGTVTSASLFADRAPAGALHQFAPIDAPGAVARFLDHWRPDLYAAVESELWPNTLAALKRRGARTALLSARLSEKSARGWARAPRAAAALLRAFDVIVPQTDEIAARIAGLGAPAERLAPPAALKDAAAPLPADRAALADWTARLGARPRWAAVSTHPGEEAAVFAAHAALAARRPGLATLLAPRHPERGPEVAAAAEAAGLRAARRGAGAPLTPETDVYVADTIGELGLWCRLAPAVFVGGSLAPEIGGHNPLEPARLGAATLYGPHMANFAAECARLEAAGAARRLDPSTPGLPAAAAALAAALDETLGAAGAALTEAGAALAAAARALPADAAALEATLAALRPLLPPVSAGAAHEKGGGHAGA